MTSFIRKYFFIKPVKMFFMYMLVMFPVAAVVMAFKGDFKPAILVIVVASIVHYHRSRSGNVYVWSGQ